MDSIVVLGSALAVVTTGLVTALFAVQRFKTALIQWRELMNAVAVARQDRQITKAELDSIFNEAIDFIDVWKELSWLVIRAFRR